MKRTRFVIVLAAMAMALLLTFLFLKTRGANLERHHQIIDRLRALKQEEVALERNVLRLRFGMVQNYDAVTHNIQQMKIFFGELQEGSFQIYHRGPSRLDEDLESYQKLLKDEELLLEDFAAENGVLNNSLRYFPVLSARVLQALEKIPGSESFQSDLNSLLRNVLVYEINNDENRAQDSQALIQSLKLFSGEPSIREDLVTASRHAEIILKNKKEVETIISNLNAMESVQSIQQIEQTYLSYFEDNMRESNIYRALLYLLCLILSGYALFIFLKLQRAAIDLKKSNETLEERVKQRTEELMKTNQALLQSEKMSAVGQLAAGVAHEINNPLGVILGFAQGLVRRLAPNDPTELPLKSIERESMRCKQLVQDLLTFSRASKTEKEEVDINQAVEGALSLITAQTKVKNIRLVKELKEGLPKLFSNSSQIQQVIINLSNNAIDAMSAAGSGTLTVRTQQTKLETKDMIQIQISDTGQGIPKEIQSKVFEPFFTTKEVGKGTGLGLSLVFEIVQKHEGRIVIDSQPGAGTTMNVFLPMRKQ